MSPDELPDRSLPAGPEVPPEILYRHGGLIERTIEADESLRRQRELRDRFLGQHPEERLIARPEAKR